MIRKIVLAEAFVQDKDRLQGLRRTPLCSQTQKARLDKIVGPSFLADHVEHQREAEGLSADSFEGRPADLAEICLVGRRAGAGL